MKGINGEEILTCLILVAIGYFIAMMFSRCLGNGFSVGGQGWDGPYCDELRDPESQVAQVQKVPSNTFDCGYFYKKDSPNFIACPNGECTEDDCCTAQFDPLKLKSAGHTVDKFLFKDPTSLVQDQWRTRNLSQKGGH